MADILTDKEIDRLVSERKPLTPDFRTKAKMRAKRGHDEREFAVTGDDGGDFVVVIRQSQFNPVSFSVILACRPAGSLVLFRLRRYNGQGHEHFNRLEDQRFTGCHIHMATERYQRLGTREDAYARPTDRYEDMEGALMAMIADCGFVMPTATGQQLLFGPN